MPNLSQTHTASRPEIPADFRQYPQAGVAETWWPVPPNNTICPHTGRKRGWFYKNVINGPMRQHVRVVHLRQPGAKRGQYMYCLNDFRDYMNKLAAEQAAARGNQ